jgi:hypothetical protein
MSDALIKQLMEQAEKKESAIKATERYSNKTNLSFPQEEDSNRLRINLNIVQDCGTLVKCLSILKREKSAFDEAAAELGLNLKFSWEGFSYEDWRDDIRNKVETINLKKERKKLSEIKATLEALLSPEAKTARQLEEIEKMLKE